MDSPQFAAADFATATLIHTSFFLGTFFFLDKLDSDALSPKVVAQKNETREEIDAKELAERRTVYMKIISLGHSAYVSYFGLKHMYTDPQMAPITHAAMSLDSSVFSDKKWLNAECQGCYHLVPIMIAFFIYELILIRHWPDMGGLAAMIIHHVMSIVLFPMATIFTTGHWNLLLFLAFEASTPFLCFKHLIEKFIGKSNLLYTINGLLLTLSFLSIRNLSIPSQLWTIYHTIPHHDDKLVAALAYAAIVPIILNSLWGVKLVKGVIKTIQGGSSKKKEKEN